VSQKEKDREPERNNTGSPKERQEKKPLTKAENQHCLGLGEMQKKGKKSDYN